MPDLAVVVAAFHPTYRVVSEASTSSIGTQYIASAIAGNQPVLITILAPEFFETMVDPQAFGVSLNRGSRIFHPALLSTFEAMVDPQAFGVSLNRGSRISHPALLSTIDGGVLENAFAYYVSAMPTGASFHNHTPSDALPLGTVTTIGSQLAHALEALHAAGFCHGWINRNLIYTGANTVQLAGAGVPQALLAAGVPFDRLPSLLFLPQYHVPEFRQGVGFPSPQGDIYTLGVFLYELATGKPPFGGRVTSATLATVLTDDSLDYGQQPSGGAQSAIYPILRAIEKSPDDRWPSAFAFQEALRNSSSASAELLLEREGVTARKGCFLRSLFSVAVVAIFLQAFFKRFIHLL